MCSWIPRNFSTRLATRWPDSYLKKVFVRGRTDHWRPHWPTTINMSRRNIIQPENEHFFILWPWPLTVYMTLTFEFRRLDLCVRDHVSSKVTVRTRRLTHAHWTICFTWTTNAIKFRGIALDLAKHTVAYHLEWPLKVICLCFLSPAYTITAWIELLYEANNDFFSQKKTILFVALLNAVVVSASFSINIASV